MVNEILNPKKWRRYCQKTPCMGDSRTNENDYWHAETGFCGVAVSNWRSSIQPSGVKYNILTYSVVVSIFVDLFHSNGARPARKFVVHIPNVLLHTENLGRSSTCVIAQQ